MIWGRAHKDKANAARFVAALNTRDFATLESLMADDFAYIDSWREGVIGRDLVMAGVRALLAVDPEFGIEVEKATFRAPHVLMRGTVHSAQFGEGRRAVWRARCQGDRLVEWQSWAEGGPPPLSRTLAPGQARDLSDRADERPDVSDL